MQVTPISTSSVAETGFTLAQTLDNHIETASVSSSERLRAKTQKEVRMRNKHLAASRIGAIYLPWENARTALLQEYNLSITDDYRLRSYSGALVPADHRRELLYSSHSIGEESMNQRLHNDDATATLLPNREEKHVRRRENDLPKTGGYFVRDLLHRTTNAANLRLFAIMSACTFTTKQGDAVRNDDEDYTATYMKSPSTETTPFPHPCTLVGGYIPFDHPSRLTYLRSDSLRLDAVKSEVADIRRQSQQQYHFINFSFPRPPKIRDRRDDHAETNPARVGGG